MMEARKRPRDEGPLPHPRTSLAKEIMARCEAEKFEYILTRNAHLYSTWFGNPLKLGV